MTNVTKKNDLFFEDLEWFVKFLWQPFVEIYWGIKKSTIPLTQLLLWSFVVGAAILFDLDLHVLKAINKLSLHPTGIVRNFLTMCLMWGGFWIWGLNQVQLRRKLMAKLTLAFVNADLVDNNGRLPSFVFDSAIDRDTRRLRIKNVGLVMKKFKDATESLEAGLGVKIVKIEEVPKSNGSLMEIVYTHEELDKKNTLEDINEYYKFSFPIGRTRTREITSSFIDVPHLLVAGATGKGKSTYLKLLASILAVNNQDAEIVFIDPKGSEISALEKFSQINCITDLRIAKEKLEQLSRLIGDRNKHFAKNGVKDLIAYNKLPYEKRLASSEIALTGNINRVIVIVDEISDFMRAHLGVPTSDLVIARQAMTRIAQMGRSSGIHIVVGVQNPDKKNIDLGLKANLIGTLCFSVRDHVGSTVVLGNRRACDLPGEIVGRAIWQLGGHQEEVQVPYLSDERIKLISENLNVTS